MAAAYRAQHLERHQEAQRWHDNAEECVGEIVNTAGAGPFEGYYNNDAANERTLRFGWYWSGDPRTRSARNGGRVTCAPCATRRRPARTRS